MRMQQSTGPLPGWRGLFFWGKTSNLWNPSYSGREARTVVGLPLKSAMIFVAAKSKDCWPCKLRVRLIAVLNCAIEEVIQRSGGRHSGLRCSMKTGDLATCAQGDFVGAASMDDGDMRKACSMNRGLP